MRMGCMANRRYVARTMPGCSDVKPLAQAGYLHSGGNASDLRNVAPDEIEQAVYHRLFELVDVIEKLTHGYWHRCGLAQLPEPLHILRREGVFDEKRPILFHGLNHVDSVHRLHALMHVV